MKEKVGKRTSLFSQRRFVQRGKTVFLKEKAGKKKFVIFSKKICIEEKNCFPERESRQKELRYLTQRFSMPDDRGKALLTDIGCEELGHVEMICTMIHQLIEGASVDEIKNAGLESWYTQHNKGVYPMDASGVPFTAAYIASTGNPIVDLQEDLAAEEKARATYENLMDLTNDESLLAPLSFLRQREVVHYTRFKELLDYYKKKGY